MITKTISNRVNRSLRGGHFVTGPILFRGCRAASILRSFCACHMVSCYMEFNEVEWSSCHPPEVAHVRPLLFPLVPVAHDRWRMRSSYFSRRLQLSALQLSALQPLRSVDFSRSHSVSFLSWPRRSYPRVPLPFRPPRHLGRLQVSCRCACRSFCGVGHVGATKCVLQETRRSGCPDPQRARSVILLY